ncbi:FUSC family protein [Streptomyces dangxiongensis]|uniref:FUSC family protein n=1 Tax=Streptomyces dangxiongensis TaxID=1442032 RepID=A0A3G2J6N9_9ACTN|nr:FUSC family protein [Streptomyces dangxiongensis]
MGRPVAATYALFAAVALGGLSRIPGTGRGRAVTVVRLLPVCWILVTIGTCLSVRTWSAVAGMLVVGFALAFAAVGGPRPAGAAPGLQLLYILPSFPPYDPASLGDRLAGTTTGVVVLAVAEALLCAEPGPTTYRELAARGALTAGRCATLLAAPPYALTGTETDAAQRAGQALRAVTVPEAQRPAGPGVRDRALTHTGLATRALLTRLAQLRSGPGRDPGPDVSAVLRAVAGLATATAACLRSGPPPTAESARLVAARAHLSALSAGPPPGTARGCHPPDRAAPAPDFPPAVLRHHAALLEIADAALAMGTAADLAVRGRHAVVEVPLGRFWYASQRAPVLWWHRLRGHAGRRSVFFQNAVRLALALTAVRLVAGVDTLPHGFWAMLATLTITRTTVNQTWSTVRLALAGTLAGALLTAAILLAVGSDTAVYAAVLPVWMLFGFTVGPVKGVGWAQGLFTVLVALVFAQLAPPTWRLAEVRLLDVLIGSAIGAVFGVLAWPRGAHDELRYAAAELLRRAAEIVVATSASVAGPDGTAAAVQSGVPGHRSLQRAVILAESAYAQFLSEPTPLQLSRRRAELPDMDWQATLMTGHHTLWGSDRLLEPPLTALNPAAATSAGALGERVAGRMLLVSAALDPGGDTPASVPVISPGAAALAPFRAEPPGAPRRYYATASWLASLMTDLARIAHTAPAPAVDDKTPGRR